MLGWFGVPGGEVTGGSGASVVGGCISMCACNGGETAGAGFKKNKIVLKLDC